MSFIPLTARTRGVGEAMKNEKSAKNARRVLIAAPVPRVKNDYCAKDFPGSAGLAANAMRLAPLLHLSAHARYGRDERGSMAQRRKKIGAKVLSLDPGAVRIGVALSDELGSMAHPRGTLAAKPRP